MYEFERKENRSAKTAFFRTEEVFFERNFWRIAVSRSSDNNSKTQGTLNDSFRREKNEE